MKNSSCTEGNPVGKNIVWRFTGDKHWNEGYADELLAGCVVRIKRREMAILGDHLVSLNDIEWHAK